MSTAILSYPQASSLFPAASYGVGDEARFLEDLYQEVIKGIVNSVSLGATQQSAFRQLYEVLRECGRPNWDGYGAEPISFGTYEQTVRFIRALPWGFPAPEISAEPDGEITLEWYTGPKRVLSVSVGPNNELTYAALFGASRAYGTEVFHDEIPDLILGLIIRVVN